MPDIPRLDVRGFFQKLFAFLFFPFKDPTPPRFVIGLTADRKVAGNDHAVTDCGFTANRHWADWQPD
jgi:hypothetical protein